MKDKVQQKIEERSTPTPQSSPKERDNINNVKEFEKALDQVGVTAGSPQAKAKAPLRKRPEHYISDDESASVEVEGVRGPGRGSQGRGEA